MINIKDLNYQVKDSLILKNINCEFPDKGLYFLLGPSGCGKTSFLNSIGGLIDFKGDILIDNISTSHLNDQDKSEMRMRNIGFIFQDFKIFNFLTVENNISFPFECVKNESNGSKERRVSDLLELVDLKDKRHMMSANLSGGEKQRIAIARALINEPRILLCDEPTGSLDESNSENILEILKTISSTRLVIVVSHDDDLAKRYADKIIYMKDGKFIREKTISRKETSKNNLPVYKSKISSNKSKIPFSFLKKHTSSSMKFRKFRSLVVNFITSLGLLGAGLSIVLSDSISSNIIDAYSSLINDRQILVSNRKEKASDYVKKSMSYDEALDIKEQYSDYIYDVGVSYNTDFENFFKDCNTLSLSDTAYKESISSYSVRNINEFYWLDLYEGPVYPSVPDSLKDDEIVLSLSVKEIKEICYALRIERTIERFSDYVRDNDLHLCLEVANNDRQYDDQQILTLRGFVVSNKSCMYHYNHLWNEHMLEERMRFPINDNLDEKDYYPWVLKRTTYFSLSSDSYSFLKEIKKNPKMDQYLFELSSDEYFPWLYNRTHPLEINRMMCFINTLNGVDSSYFSFIRSIYPDLSNPLFSSIGGYSIYGSNLLSGFARPIYLSSDEYQLDRCVNEVSKNIFSNLNSLILPDGVIDGYYAKASDKCIMISSQLCQEELNNISSVNDVYISSSLALSLFGKEDVIGEKIYSSYLTDYKEMNENNFSYEFTDAPLTIVGVKKNDKNLLYQDEYWSFLMFECLYGVSAYYLHPNGISFLTPDSKDNSSIIKRLEKEFPNLKFEDPLAEINMSVNGVTDKLEFFLLLLSIIAIIISILLLTICNYLHIMEIKKDIGLVRCLGVNKKEAKKLLYYHSFKISLIAWVLAALEIFFITLICHFAMEDIFVASLKFRFSLIPYAVMLLLSLLLGGLSTLFVQRKIGRLNPLDCLKN